MAKKRRGSATRRNGAEEPARPTGSGRSIRIRMYNCGFGDCFLIFAPTLSGPDKKILIDCGSFKAQARPINEIVGRVIEDLRETDGTARIDLLIVTHRHKDHIVGFADPRWSEVEVGEVWMLPEVTFYVLGPSRNADTIFDMNPPSGESFLALLGVSDDLEARQAQIPEPFGMDWVDEGPRDPLDESTRERLENIHDGLETKLAIALDNALNNTSLVLMLVIRNAHLLFPGDAQWGTWRELMNDDAVCQLLRNTTFYKVGHHGSHNATPVSFVEKYLGANGGDTWAMVPVTPYKKWPEIPRKQLLDEIRAKTTHFVRSDQRRNAPGFTRDGNWCVEAAIPAE
jgi:beta-lactamase superfamily II metal-dependent hydrolase